MGSGWEGGVWSVSLPKAPTAWNGIPLGSDCLVGTPPHFPSQDVIPGCDTSSTPLDVILGGGLGAVATRAVHREGSDCPPASGLV